MDKTVVILSNIPDLKTMKQEKKYDPINVQKAQQQKEKSFTSN